MRTALLLLLLLAVAAVPGSLLPQEPVNPPAVSGFLMRHATVGPWLQRLGGFDVYASPWFASIYLLLMVSLIGCVVPRLSRHWQALRSAPPPTPSNLSRLPAYACRVIVDTRSSEQPTPDLLLRRAADALRRRGYRVRHVAAGGSVAAEKGYLAETGNLLFHLSILGVLVAVAVGSFNGWSGQALVIEGQTFANVPTAYDSLRMGTLVADGELPPFAVALRKMTVRFADSGPQRGAPREFQADLAVSDGGRGQLAERVRLRVNHPLSVAGAKVYLVGNGYAPRVTVWDRDGRQAFSGPVPFLPRDGQYTSVGAVKVPDARPSQIGLAGLLLPTAEFDPSRGPISTFPDLRRPRLVLTAYAGDLGLDNGAPQSVYTLDTSRMTQSRASDGEPIRLLLAPGGSEDLPGGGRVRFDGVARYAALDVRHDPGKILALVASSLALGGLIASLFVRRRRVWVRVTSEPDGTAVEVGGLTRGTDPTLARRIDDFLSEICSESSTGPQPGSRESLVRPRS
jgi:cytochrome c biogenesis protein